MRIAIARLLYEIAFSIYFAGMVVLVDTARERSSFLGGPGYLLNQCYQLLGKFGHDADFFPGPTVHLAMLWGLFALGIWVGLELLGRIPLVRMFLGYAAGFVIFTVFPWALFNSTIQLQLRLELEHLMMFELIAGVAYVCFYVHRGWRTSAVMSVIVGLLHFGLWTWLSSIFLIYALDRKSTRLNSSHRH